MAKKARYPRKLRQTLERVKDAAAAREQPQEPDIDPFKTHWREFLRPGSVHTMHTRLEPEEGRMVIASFLKPPARPDVVLTRAPWLDDILSRETVEAP